MKIEYEVLNPEMAQHLRERALGLFDDAVELKLLGFWKEYIEKYNIDSLGSWLNLMKELNGNQRSPITRTILALVRNDYKTLGDVRKATIPELTHLKWMTQAKADFIYRAVRPLTDEEKRNITPPRLIAKYRDPHNITQLPTKKELEDFLRKMNGVPPKYGGDVVFNLETGRFERQ